MTVAIALVCSDGALVAADSTASSGAIAVNAVKVHIFETVPLVWAAAGAVYVIEEIVTELTTLQVNLTKTESTAAEFTQPNLGALRGKLHANVTRVMKRCYGAALPFGLQQVAPGTGTHPFATDCLFAGFANGTAYLLEVSRDGQVNWHTEEAFYAVGSGGEFAAVAQALMKHHLDEGPLPLTLGMQVAYRTIETTCEVSSAHVGMPVQMAVVDSSGTRLVDVAEMDEIRTGVAGWKQLERDVLRGTVGSQLEPPEAPPQLAGK